eukprot:1077360-Amorphochlora_amoeboformis.AAC.2
MDMARVRVRVRIKSGAVVLLGITADRDVGCVEVDVVGCCGPESVVRGPLTFRVWVWVSVGVRAGWNDGGEVTGVNREKARI